MDYHEILNLFFTVSSFVYTARQKDYPLWLRITICGGNALCAVAFIVKSFGIFSEAQGEIIDTIGMTIVAVFAVIIFVRWLKREIKEAKEELSASPFEKAERKYRRSTKKSKKKKAEKYFH